MTNNEKTLSPREAIENERLNQDLKWGIQNHDDAHWLTILTEEVGEVAECMCNAKITTNSEQAEKHNEQMDAELVQCAAVIIAWLECRARMRSAQ